MPKKKRKSYWSVSEIGPPPPPLKVDADAADADDDGRVGIWKRSAQTERLHKDNHSKSTSMFELRDTGGMTRAITKKLRFSFENITVAYTNLK